MVALRASASARGAALAASLLIAGCRDRPRAARRRSSASADAHPDARAPTGLPEDRERHRVALLVPMTGTNAAVGQSIANAANLALLDTGGGAYASPPMTPPRARAAAAQRAIDDGNKLILGPLLADDVRLSRLTRGARGVPIISFSNDASVAGRRHLHHRLFARPVDRPRRPLCALARG